MLKLDLQFFGGRGASSASGGSGKMQTEHMDHWGEPPSRGEQLSEYLGISKAEGSKEYEAIKDWSGSSYSSIRAAEYNNDVGTSSYQKAMEIEKFIKQSPKWAGGELYRGVGLDQSTIDALKPGAVIDMQGLSSWSSDFLVAKDFSGNGGKSSVIFKTAGTKKGTSITHLSIFGKGEGEVLISGKATWKVNKIEQSGNTTIVTVKERR